ncbi:hypothetical protein [Croceimicrobium hydrocarbonivorans]|uniref:Uncharacterized protein n=1 Tax=Croceimicrobium hydrocarbonivorans TaxID=2761580 RepID=A0A7H0VHL0_9FLAO|nr:hypothetical protein [Croceimicrobium hydrocarbonivorans]QNR25208.1 hypothetical protein H4K34_05035 [Croceimicrobium hydrocarbonivorans]
MRNLTFCLLFICCACQQNLMEQEPTENELEKQDSSSSSNTKPTKPSELDLAKVYIFQDSISLYDAPTYTAKKTFQLNFGDSLYFEAHGGHCYDEAESRFAGSESWSKLISPNHQIAWTPSRALNFQPKTYQGNKLKAVFQSFCGDGQPQWRNGKIIDSENNTIHYLDSSCTIFKGYWLAEDSCFLYSDQQNLYCYSKSTHRSKKLLGPHLDILLNAERNELIYLVNRWNQNNNGAYPESFIALLKLQDFSTLKIPLDFGGFTLGDEDPESASKCQLRLDEYKNQPCYSFLLSQYKDQTLLIEKWYLSFEGQIIHKSQSPT